MRIQSIKIPDSIALRTGLKEVEMTKLGQVVVVAGKNGSGKSRLFKLVQLEVQDIPTEEVQIENEDKYAQYTYNKNHWQGQQQAALAKNPPDNMQLRTIQQHLDSNLQELSKLEAGRDRLSRIIIEGNVNPSKVVEFVPKDLNLTDAYTLNEHQLDENSRRIYSKGTGGSSLGTIPAIQKVVRRYSLAKSQVTTASQEENERSIRNFEKLKEYIQLFLSAELGISPDGHAELFGKRIGEAALSDGQKILLQFCLAIYAQETSLNELVIFMDEPENHLHPGALTSVLDKIIEHLSAGQLWISTHSIHIL
ncbi:MAG: ATP-binding protein, partial [Proteobacteria bacterium]